MLILFMLNKNYKNEAIYLFSYADDCLIEYVNWEPHLDFSLEGLIDSRRFRQQFWEDLCERDFRQGR
jgi:hypothetical protein